MSIAIGPYILSQRTEYSKFRIYNTKTKKDLADTDKEYTKIISDYIAQKEAPEKYFEIDKDKLIDFKKSTDNIKYVFVPYNVTMIKDYAFKRSNFSYISLPENLGYIGDYAFSNCSSLRQFDLPESVEFINSGILANCFNLQSVKLSPSLSRISTNTFLNCISLKNIDLSGIEAIGNYAFAGCTALKNINMSNTIGTIEAHAFEGCENLEKINLPETIVYMGEDCFSGCYNLKEISLPNNLTRLNNPIFRNTKKLENINVPKKLSNVRNVPFGFSNIKSLTFNYDLHTLDTSHFFDNDLISESNINKLIINNTVNKITPDAFKYSGRQIKIIDYQGTKSEFEEFKNNNQGLFNLFTNLEEINFIDENEKDMMRTSIIER